MSQGSRTGRFVKNTLATAAYHIVAMLLGLITPRLMMLHYGSGVNGLIVSITDFLTYFRMVDAGLAAASIYALYEPLAKEDHSAVSGVISAVRIFYLQAGWLFSAITIAFAFIYPFVVPVMGADGIAMSHLSIMLLILAMGLSGALEFFMLSRYRVLLNADQRTFVISLVSMISLILRIAIIVVLPSLGMDVISVHLLASLTIILRPLILLRYTAKHYPKVDPFAPPRKSALNRRGDALLFELTDVFMQGAGVILVTLITRDTAIISVYGVYHMVTVGLGSVLKMGTTGIYAIFGNLLVSGDHPRFQRAYRDFECLYQVICATLYGVAGVLIMPFVRIYTYDISDANYDAPILALLIILEALTYQCRAPLDLMIPASGAFRGQRKQSIVQIVVTLVLGVSFGLMGLTLGNSQAVCGVILGVIMGNVVRLLMQLAFVPKQIIKRSGRENARRIACMFIAVVFISVACLLLIELPRWLDEWVLYALFLVPVAAVISFVFAWLFDPVAFRSLIRRLRIFMNFASCTK